MPSMVPMLVGVYLFIAVVWFFVAGSLLRWLWNITLPELFKVPVIGYWQAIRLILIGTLIFGGGAFFSLMANFSR